MKLIDNLPTKPTPAIWRPLLAASRCYGNVKMAEFVAKCILGEDLKDPTVYVTLSNAYAKAGRPNDAVKQRQLWTEEFTSSSPKTGHTHKQLTSTRNWKSKGCRSEKRVILLMPKIEKVIMMPCKSLLLRIQKDVNNTDDDQRKL